ncbi:hypothetical protein GCM10027426_00840 [Microbacterium lacusdiani]
MGALRGTSPQGPSHAAGHGRGGSVGFLARPGASPLRPGAVAVSGSAVGAGTAAVAGSASGCVVTAG